MVRAWLRDSPAAALTAAIFSLVMSATARRQSLFRLYHGYPARRAVAQTGVYNEGELEAPHTRILALDLGKKRIGMAISDPLGITAQGLPNLVRTNKRADLEALGNI